jgi:hypothetical protein
MIISSWAFILNWIIPGELADKLMSHERANHCEYFSDGAMHGILYEVCGYPGAIETSVANEKVFGELYKRLDRKQVLNRLDVYEECSDRFPRPPEYYRKHLSIELSSGSLGVSIQS